MLIEARFWKMTWWAAQVKDSKECRLSPRRHKRKAHSGRCGGKYYFQMSLTKTVVDPRLLITIFGGKRPKKRSFLNSNIFSNYEGISP